MKYIIREATFSDAEGIAKVHIQSWREAYVGIISDDYLGKRKLDERIDRWKEILSEKKELV